MQKVQYDNNQPSVIDTRGTLRYGVHEWVGIYKEDYKKPQIMITFKEVKPDRFKSAVHQVFKSNSPVKVAKELRVSLSHLFAQTNGKQEIQDYQIVYLVENHGFNPAFFYDDEVTEMFLVPNEGADT